jgi:hypothetical protein
MPVHHAHLPEVVINLIREGITDLIVHDYNDPDASWRKQVAVAQGIIDVVRENSPRTEPLEVTWPDLDTLFEDFKSDSGVTVVYQDEADAVRFALKNYVNAYLIQLKETSRKEKVNFMERTGKIDTSDRNGIIQTFLDRAKGNL